MTKNDMASVSKNDGGAAKTRLDGESAAGDDELALLLDALRAPSFEQDSIWHGPKAIYATKPRALLTQAAEALTSLRTELDEARADQSRAEIRFGNALARAEGDRRAAEARALKAEAENKALREALEPFKRMNDANTYPVADHVCIPVAWGYIRRSLTPERIPMTSPSDLEEKDQGSSGVERAALLPSEASCSTAQSGAGKWRKRPVEVDAFPVSALRSGHQHASGWNEQPEWVRTARLEGRLVVTPSTVLVQTLEGSMRAQRSDWIVRGVAGELYPVKPDIFAASYEPADDTPPLSARPGEGGPALTLDETNSGGSDE